MTFFIGENNGIGYTKGCEVKGFLNNQEVELPLEFSHEEQHANGEPSYWSKLNTDDLVPGTTLVVRVYNWVKGQDWEEVTTSKQF